MATMTTAKFCGLEMNEVRRVALEKLFGRISDVASFPATAQKLLELTADESSSAADVRELIQTDPALVANILKRVNSSFYGLANKVTDIRSALSVLGMREIRNMAMTVFLGKISDSKSEHGTFRRQALWDHSVAVGVTCRMLAKTTGRGVPEEAYMAGLLHDFGYILCDQFLKTHFYRIIDQLSEQVPTPEVENEVFTFDHAMLGGFVAEKWKFPESTIDAITFHHKPQEYRGLHEDTLGIVVVANYLCSQAGILSLGVNNALAPHRELLSSLAIDPASLPALTQQALEAVQSAKASATVS